MKRISFLVLLLVICFLPFVADAKVDYKVKWTIEKDLFLYEENGKYYCLADVYEIYNLSVYDLDYYYINVYDENGKFLYEEKLFDSEKITYEELKKTKVFKALNNYIYLWDDFVYDGDSAYKIDLYREKFLYYVFENDEFKSKEKLFSDDLDYTKNLLGKKYDIYFSKPDNINIRKTSILDNGMICILYYDYDKENSFTLLVDENLNEILKFENLENDDSVPQFLIEGEYIFYNKAYDNIEIYNLDGELFDTISIDDSFLEDTSHFCGSYGISSITVNKRNLIINYNFYGCPKRIEVTDANDIVKTQAPPRSYILNLDLKFDVIKVESTGGDFTYTEKIDENGNEYVELNIVPDKGYSIKEIIVTDLNGNKIDVTDNKFYMPMSDVKVEVKYVNGEYLPIPDTFLGKSTTLILIGLILVSLGVYTINYVKNY